MARTNGAAATRDTLRFVEMPDGMPLLGRDMRGLLRQDLSCRC